MMRALAARGHRVYALEPVGHLLGRATARGRRVVPLAALARTITTGTTAGAPEDRALKDFAAVLMRKDPPFDMEYVYATYLLEAAEREGARVFNRPRAIRDHNEKLAIAQFARVHRADARHARRGADRRLHRRARRRHPEAARRHGRDVGVPRARRRPEPQRDRRDRQPPRRAHGDGAALHSRDRRRRQARAADRRRARAVRARAHPQGGRDARQPRRRRPRRRAPAHRARPRDRRGAGAARCGPRACWSSASTSSATT